MYQKILVPLDGTGMAECSLSHAEEIARGCGTAEIILLEAVEPISNESVQYLSHAGKDTFDAEEQNRAGARKYLEQTGDKLRSDGFNVTTAITDGHPERTIPEFALNNKVDLIIISTYGRSRTSKWFNGTTADEVMRQSAIPILLVAPEGCRI
jgi:nucleotide-binding universal stress UspA family protein